MADMISASDVLQILSEIHQFSMILIELREPTTLGLSHLSEGRLNCFSIDRPLGTGERIQLVNDIYGGKIPASLVPLTMEQFLKLIEGKKPKHIWLEARGTERKELGFMSIAELKAHFRIHPKRQH